MKKPRMTDEQVLYHIQNNTPLNKLRVKFSGHAGKIGQAALQRTPLSPVEHRRLEFEAVEDLKNLFYELEIELLKRGV